MGQNIRGFRGWSLDHEYFTHKYFDLVTFTCCASSNHENKNQIFQWIFQWRTEYLLAGPGGTKINIRKNYLVSLDKIWVDQIIRDIPLPAGRLMKVNSPRTALSVRDHSPDPEVSVKPNPVLTPGHRVSRVKLELSCSVVMKRPICCWVVVETRLWFCMKARANLLPLVVVPLESAKENYNIIIIFIS